MSGLSRHEGRQVNTWGDSVIAEFASVVEAVRCAVEIQDSLGAENRVLPQSQQMWFRIGINLGDVMVDGNDLYGDGVNVAQRLESLAEPGGILVSGTVHSLAHKQLSLAFDFAGEQEIKNSADRVPSYRVRMTGRNLPDAAADAAGGTDAAESPRAPSRFAKAAFRLDQLWGWLVHQPWSMRFSIGMIVFFFLINLLFSGLASPWFIFPSAPFALFVFLKAGRDGKRRPP
jgi:adenylate cyclase